MPALECGGGLPSEAVRILARLAVPVLLAAGLLPAQRAALFLTDGTRIGVREYAAEGDRVRYYSLERGQWELVPAEIVDWDRTDAYNARERAVAEARAAEERRERIAERRARTELHTVPLDDGVYYIRGEEFVPLEQATLHLGKSKGRTVLNVLAPMPVMAGKRTLSITGTESKLVTADDRPAFYMRLNRFSRFGISRIKPEPKRKRRIVQQIYTVPKSEEQAEAQEEVDVFRQQLAPLVYKVWPVDPLEAGEYALVEYTPGESDLRAWDFSHRPVASPGTR